MKTTFVALMLLATAMAAGAQTTSPKDGAKPRAQKETLATIYPDFTTGFSQGLKNHRIIIVFFRDKSTFTTQMETEVRKLRADPLLSEVYLFTESLLPDDRVGMKAAKQLKIEGVPAVSVLAPDPTMPKELTRFEGVFPFAKLREGIIGDTCKNSKYKDGRESLAPWTALVLGCVMK